MKVVFMGTPAFAVPTLEALMQAHHVAAVLTQPDRPSGRGGKLTPSPVKELAVRHGIPVYQPATLFIKKKTPRSWVEPLPIPSTTAPPDPREIRALLASLQADAFIVAAYGLLLPKAVLDMPRLGCINVHGSLLPRYRGAAPIHAAIVNGDTVTGITIMHMAEGMDTGDMILQRQCEIPPGAHFPALYDRMAALGAEALTEALTALENNTAARIPQDDAAATFAPIIKKDDGYIAWTQPTAVIINKIRAYDPWPGTYTLCGGRLLKIGKAEALCVDANPACAAAAPGTVLAADKDGLVVRTGDGALRALELQGPNGKKMPAGDYLRGRAIQVGAVLPF